MEQRERVRVKEIARREEIIRGEVRKNKNGKADVKKGKVIDVKKGDRHGE